MKILVALLIVFSVSIQSFSQVAVPVTVNAEQQLESSTASNEGQETEDDAYLQQMIHFIKNPIEMNVAEEAELNQLKILTAVQVQNFLNYRKLTGKLINVYELQAIPAWDIDLIRKLQPYIIVSNKVAPVETLKTRLKNGEHQILFRLLQVPERSVGYLKDKATTADFYAGSPQKILLRYQYNFKSLLQYGIVAEKDGGEQFFKGKQKAGFDFYSAHIFIRKLGIIKALALGDFSVNLGQGLIQWQSLAFSKNADVLNIKREAAVIRPYNSAGEINFHRGFAITLAKRNWQFSVFASYRKTDANFVADTSQNREGFVSSLQTTGYHRTKAEMADKGIQGQLSFGGNFSYRIKKLHLGINTVHYKFRLPIKKSSDPYNSYALNGKNLVNYSIDYSYTSRNMHFFGEAAFSGAKGKAFVGGLLISVSANADIGLLYRNISRSYQSLYANGFTEASYPANENGLYAGVALKPASNWRVDVYADLYKFPWLKYRVDAPATGSDYLVQLNYKPNKQIEINTRFHAQSKSINFNPLLLATAPLIQQPKQNWRTQLNYQLSSSVAIRCRNEIMWFDKKGQASETGYLLYFDFIYKPMLRPYAANARIQYFETEGYNSRIYAYENDILYNFSVPAFYDKGYKYYINLNYYFNKSVCIWLKWAQTFYRDKTRIGSGLDEINGNTKSDIKLQVSCIF